jgi:UDP-glucose 4-epimerase
MNILITGGSGFIGRNLIEYLSGKHRVYAPRHKELDLLNEEEVDKFFLKQKIDVVIHCAVRPGHRNALDPSNELYHNTKMFFNLVKNDKKFKRLIYLGSGLEYDLRYYKSKMKEEYFGEHIPEDEGGFSKYIISRYIEDHKNIIELRILGIFGKYEDYAIRFISNLICKSIFSLPLTMKQNRKFDYIYVNDLMPIIDHFLSAKPKKHNIFNVTPDKSIELINLAEKIKQISGTKQKVMVAKKGIGTEYSADNKRLKGEMPNLQFTPIDDAIKELYDWYLQNMDQIDKKKLLVDK